MVLLKGVCSLSPITKPNLQTEAVVAFRLLSTKHACQPSTLRTSSKLRLAIDAQRRRAPKPSCADRALPSRAARNRPTLAEGEGGQRTAKQAIATLAPRRGRQRKPAREGRTPAARRPTNRPWLMECSTKIQSSSARRLPKNRADDPPPHQRARHVSCRSGLGLATCSRRRPGRKQSGPPQLRPPLPERPSPARATPSHAQMRRKSVSEVEPGW